VKAPDERIETLAPCPPLQRCAAEVPPHVSGAGHTLCYLCWLSGQPVQLLPITAACGRRRKGQD